MQRSGGLRSDLSAEFQTPCGVWTTFSSLPGSSRCRRQNALAFAVALSALDRSWGTETLAVAGGQLVLCGPGLYVNRAIATGIGCLCARPTSG